MTMIVALELSEISGMQSWTVLANDKPVARFEFHRTEGRALTLDGEEIKTSRTFMVDTTPELM